MAEAGRYQLAEDPMPRGWLAGSGPELAQSFPELPLPVLHRGRPALAQLIDRTKVL